MEQQKTVHHSETNSKIVEERREFLKKFVTTVFAGLLTPAFLAAAPGEEKQEEERTISLPELPEPDPEEGWENPVVRMMRDLQRALRKPIGQRHWIMVIDLRKCVGCNACTIACISENRLPPGVLYRPVIEEEMGEYPNVTRRFIPRPCMHCEHPPCTPVCPVKATYKRPDGIVVVDYDRCIGCRYCLTACPYNARTFDFGEYYTENRGIHSLMPYEKVPTGEYDKMHERTHNDSPVGNVRKCHFCLHRIERGLLPQCVVTCIGRATYFGDMKDTHSLVSQLIAKTNVMQLKEELGTHPKVYYLI